MSIASKHVKRHTAILMLIINKLSTISKYHLQNALSNISQVNSPKNVIPTLEYFIFSGLYQLSIKYVRQLDVLWRSDDVHFQHTTHGSLLTSSNYIVFVRSFIHF